MATARPPTPSTEDRQLWEMCQESPRGAAALARARAPAPSTEETATLGSVWKKLSWATALQLLEEKLLEEAGWPEQERSLFKLDRIGMWTKLRPGVRAMLAQLAPMFQMWIFTNGTRCVCMHAGSP